MTEKDLPWPPTGYSRAGSGSMSNGVVAFKIDVPANAPPGNTTSTVGRLQIATNTTDGSEPCQRNTWLSTEPGGKAFYKCAPKQATAFVLFTVGAPNAYGGPSLVPGKTVYLNVENLSCPPNGKCGVYADLYPTRA